VSLRPAPAAKGSSSRSDRGEVITIRTDDPLHNPSLRQSTSPQCCKWCHAKHSRSEAPPNLEASTIRRVMPEKGRTLDAELREGSSG
jgi:hypothetical protein